MRKFIQTVYIANLASQPQLEKKIFQNIFSIELPLTLLYIRHATQPGRSHNIVQDS